MIPRMLRPTTHRDLRVELFGQMLESPLLIAPVGVQPFSTKTKNWAWQKWQPRLECHTSSARHRVAVSKTLRRPMVMGSDGISCTGHKMTRSPYLYVLAWRLYRTSMSASNLRQLTFRFEKLLRRAQSHGYKVLVVTLDTWALSWRPADLDNAYGTSASLSTSEQLLY